MTNLKKFIEIMNKTFDAQFKPENMILQCSPCGALKIKSYACDHFKCEGCEKWWHKEYHPIGISHEDFTILMFALRYAATRRTCALNIVCDCIKAKLPMMTEEQRMSIHDETVSENNAGWISNSSAQVLHELLEEINKYDKTGEEN